MRKASMNGVFDAIRKERKRQDALYGSLDDREPSLSEWAAILSAEVGEIWEGIIKDHSQNDVAREMLHVAAVAVAALQQHGLPVEEDDGFTI